MNKDNSDINQKNSLSLKSSFSYGAAGASNVYFLIFGITFRYVPLMIFQFIVVGLTIMFIFIFLKTRRKMFQDMRIIKREIFGLSIPIILSIVIGFFTVTLEFKNGMLSSISNRNLIFAFLNLALFIFITIWTMRHTKRWYHTTK